MEIKEKKLSWIRSTQQQKPIMPPSHSSMSDENVTSQSSQTCHWRPALATPAPRAPSSESTYLQALSVDKHLSNGFASLVDIFNLFRCDVFSLCQFKYMLFPVDNLQGTVLFIREGGCAWAMAGSHPGSLTPSAGHFICMLTYSSACLARSVIIPFHREEN